MLEIPKKPVVIISAAHNKYLEYWFSWLCIGLRDLVGIQIGCVMVLTMNQQITDVLFDKQTYGG
jgi:hypothetical protein